MGMHVDPKELQPLFIGGVGGSGTRIVVEILRTAGFNIGNYHSRALDNLYFFVVTNRDPNRLDWPYSRFEPYLRIFHKLNFGKPLSPVEMFRLAEPAIRSRTKRRMFNIVRHSLRHPAPYDPQQPWLSKNPTSQFYLAHLVRFFPGCRYIHVMRNGLDMAFSKNMRQLHLFGPRFDIDLQDTSTSWQAKQLHFWGKANKYVLDQSGDLLPGRHHVLRYDTLCAEPETEIRLMLDFLEYQPGVSPEDLAALVRPTTIGRYKNEDLSQFADHDLRVVEELGF